MASTSTSTANAKIPDPSRRTIWGLRPVDIHDRFWASSGICAIRAGEPSAIPDAAELFLLTPPNVLVTFRIAPLISRIAWTTPDYLIVEILDRRQSGYGELAVADDDGDPTRIERVYDKSSMRRVRVLLTGSRETAEAWQQSKYPTGALEELVEATGLSRGARVQLPGQTFDTSNTEQLSRFVEELATFWRRPRTTIRRVSEVRGEVWADSPANVAASARVIGPVWVGSGRSIGESDCVVGPAVLWDDANHAETPEPLRWSEIQPTDPSLRSPPETTARPIGYPGKRLFDLVLAIVALIVLLPLFPIIALAILIEDGWPIFFVHWRETTGGRDFPCIKFRTMRNDAAEIKEKLKQENAADGPQFFMKHDPRVTKIGHFLRKSNLDEIPQILNVIAGDMSFVGPRPSPFEENQYCPAWREARLSVRPGITGLWQVARTREPGLDFQEWIKFDLEYVADVTFIGDLKILVRTGLVVFGRSSDPNGEAHGEDEGPETTDNPRDATMKG